MARIPSLLLLALGAASLLACRGPVLAAANANGAASQQPTARMTPTPANAVLTPTRGQTVSVTLDGLAATGYAWHLQEGYDTRVISPKGQRYGELAGTPLAGQSAAEIFDFQAEAAGTTTLVFVAYRDWEGPSKDADTRRFTVTVR